VLEHVICLADELHVAVLDAVVHLHARQGGHRSDTATASCTLELHNSLRGPTQRCSGDSRQSEGHAGACHFDKVAGATGADVCDAGARVGLRSDLLDDRPQRLV
jgi:hypothetical protein